jgi:ABC-type Zn uptake system ZnuABC Zn-binding protein ZnuA
MKRRFVLSLGLAVAVAGLAGLMTGCQKGGSADPWESAHGRPKVLVSFAPLYSFASSVAGPDADVKCLLTTTGPHNEGDATTQQINLARGCDVFIINGLGLEDEANGISSKLEKTAANPKWNVLNLGSKLDKKLLLDAEEEAGEEHGHDHHHGAHDPHVWLSIPCAKAMVEAIRDELMKLDPAHEKGYATRAVAYLEKLDRLEAEGKAMLANKKERRILSFHESLSYFAKSYGLEIAGAIEVNPGHEPTPDKLNQIIKMCQDPNKPVRVIAVEPQFPTRTSANAIRSALLGKKIEAEFAEVDPLETCAEADLKPELYDDVMRRNLKELARVLR